MQFYGFDNCDMESKLKQKSFSDVLEAAIKQRWGKKRKTSLVNFPRESKKYKVNSLGFATSQQDSRRTSIADQEPFSQSQPIISERKLLHCAKQAVREWKPPLKALQEIKNRNATSAGLTTSLKISKNKPESKGFMYDNNLQENVSHVNLVNSKAKNGSENVLDKYTAHEGNSAQHETEEHTGRTSLALKDDAQSAYLDVTQTLNFQRIKSQCPPTNTDLAVQENTEVCIQNSIFNKQPDLENPVCLDLATIKSTGYEFTISAVNGNSSISKIIESVANSEETLSNTDTEAELKSDENSLSQQSTQPYILNDNITHAENIVIPEKEIEKLPDNCEVLSLVPEASIFENPSPQTAGIPDVTINASCTVSNIVNEDTHKGFPLCSAECIPNEKVTAAMEEKLLPEKEVYDTLDSVATEDKLVPEKEVQETLDSNGFKEFLKEEPLRAGKWSPIISGSKIPQIIKYGLCKQNDDNCISDTGNPLNAKKTYRNEENIVGDSSVSEENIVITRSTKSKEETNSNKKCEKGSSPAFKSWSAETRRSKPCVEINTYTDADAYVGINKSDENKIVVFDAKTTTHGLEAFRNIFHFENYTEETPCKDNNPMFDNNEKCSITTIDTACKQDVQMKISENHHASVATGKLNEDSSVCHISEETNFLEETNTDKSKDDIVINTVAHADSSALKRTCESSKYALKWTEHTTKAPYNKEVTKANYNTVVLPMETANLHKEPSTPKLGNGDQDVKCTNNTKSLETKENVTLIAAERSNNFAACGETEPLHKNSVKEEKQNSKYLQTEVISTACSQTIVSNDGTINSENKISLQGNSSDFVFEKETLTENHSEEKCITYQKNKLLENNTINNENGFASQSAIVNPETLHMLDQKGACTVNLKTNNKNLVGDYNSSKTEEYVDETNTNHCSWNERLKDRPKDVMHTAYFSSNTKKVKPLSTDMRDQIATLDAEVKNNIEVLSNLKGEQFPRKNKTEMENGDFTLTDNEEPDQVKFKNHKPENIHAVLIPDVTNDEVAAKNNSGDFSEMEDDFGLTVSQILRIEDECKQKMFMPEMSSLQWAQKVKESRRKVQAVIQEITMLNAMLKKARKEVWQPQSSANIEESTSTAEDFSTFPRPASYRCNRNLNLKFGVQRK